eukprot:1015993-Pelagomonas_calceolata.AAC.1
MHAVIPKLQPHLGSSLTQLPTMCCVSAAACKQRHSTGLPHFSCRKWRVGKGKGDAHSRIRV